MKLNILNYNPDLKIDTEYVDELINMLNNVKNNLNTEYYYSYQQFLNKINKFIGMITPNLKKELEAQSKKQKYFDDNIEDNEHDRDNIDDDDDNISIASISEYEEDDDANDIEELQIEQFENNLDVIFPSYMDCFDFEFEKVY